MTRHPSRRLTLHAALAFTLGLSAIPLQAIAQTAPDRPLRVVLPVGAGSGVDTIMRAVGPPSRARACALAPLRLDRSAPADRRTACA